MIPAASMSREQRTARLHEAVGADPPARSALIVAPGDDERFPLTHRIVWHEDVEVLHRDLRALGHLDLIVDATGAGRAPARLRRCVTALRAGGRLVMVRPAGGGALEGLLGKLLALAGPGGDAPTPPRRYGDPRPRPERHLAAFAASVGDLTVDEDLVQLTCTVDALDLAGETEVDALLADRPSLGHSTPIGRPAAEGCPALRLRVQHEAVCHLRGPVAVDDVLLPASYRDPYAERLKSPAVLDWSTHSARLDEPTAPAERLDGAWLHLDNVMRGHFGHALTEQVSLLWALPEALAAEPDVGLLVTARDGGPAGWETELLTAFGVDPARIHVARAPVRVERLLTATPAYVVQRHVHPVMREIYAAAGARLRAHAGPGPRPARVFLTRTDDKRACLNRADVERLVTDHGFTVLRPETLPLAEQAAVVGGAEVVAGFAGSAMFHLALTPGPVRALVLASTDYHAWNEQALGRLRGHVVEVLRSSASDLDPRGGIPMHAAYAVDLDALDRALSGVPA